MKRTTIYAVMVMVVLAASIVSAQDLTVSYVEGKAELQSGSVWQELNIGDPVPAGATVRLSDASYLVIAGGPARLALSQGGTYSLDRLLANSRELSSIGVGRALSSRLSVLFGAPSAQSTTMGVRAEKADTNSGISWITSDAQVYVDSGKSYIKSGDYPKAIDELKQAADSATAGELPVVRYYLGYAYSLAGNTREALKQVVDLRPSDVDTADADLVILKGKLLFDTNAFAQDIQWLTANADLVKDDVRRGPLYYLLLGLSYNGAGDTAAARANLQKVVSMAGNNDLGKTATALLQQR